MLCHTSRGRWAVQLLQCTASLPGGTGQCNSCNALPHCLGALGTMGSATPAMCCLTAWGQWAVQVGSGQCKGAVGSATPAMHCLTA